MLCLLGVTCTQLYGVLKWEIAGELPMTSMIHGQGENCGFNLLMLAVVNCDEVGCISVHQNSRKKKTWNFS